MKKEKNKLIPLIENFEKLEDDDKSYISGIAYGFAIKEEQAKLKEKEIKTKEEKGA